MTQVLIGSLIGCAVGLGAWAWAQVLSRAEPLESSGSPSVSEEETVTAVESDRRRPRSPLLLAALLAGGLAVLGAYAGWKSGRTDTTAMALLYTGILVTLAVVDFRVRRIPNVVLIALLAWGLAEALWVGQPGLVAAGLGLALGGGLFLLLALLRRGGMGAGDVKLAAVLGAILGFPAILPALLGGTLAGGLAAAFLLATRRAGRKDPMAYGPYLALGAWIIWAWMAGLTPWPAPFA